MGMTKRRQGDDRATTRNGPLAPLKEVDPIEEEETEPERTWITEDEAWKIVDLVNFETGDD
jgi:hypothetical protein